MMYQEKMVVAAKVNGKILRERGDAVMMPFGSEYSLLVKNLNSVRALVKIWIDGTDATEGTSGLIVPPNTSIDLERFIKNGNLDAGNRFKFIERTAAVSEHRGNKIDDGLIRIEFEFERIHNINSVWLKKDQPVWPKNPYPEDPWKLTTTTTTTTTTTKTYGSSGIGGSSAVSDTAGIRGITRNSIGAASSCKATYDSAPVASANASVNEVGITVPGSVSNQQFTWGQSFSTDGVKHAMVLRMLGEVQGVEVQAPITVKFKPTCVTCGKTNKVYNNYCSECGTALTIV